MRNEERWADIPGFPYQVSDRGRVRRSAPGKATKAGRVLKLRPARNGYLRAQLYRDGARQRFQVSRLVASAFVPKPEGADEVNHINGDKQDNRAENLEWVTRSGNMIHAYKNGFHSPGSSRPAAKLDEPQVRAIRAHHERGATQAALAREFDVHPVTIWKIVHRKAWTHI